MTKHTIIFIVYLIILIFFVKDMDIFIIGGIINYWLSIIAENTDHELQNNQRRRDP